MLDTVILNLPKGYYKVLKPEMFTPNANILNGPGNYLVKCVNNPTALDKKEGIYKPRMTLTKRITKVGSDVPLKIEFSVAKMVYGNNVDEVQESDFESVVKALVEAVYKMGVIVTRKDVEESRVSTFHASKNIELMDGYSSRFVISELSKVDASKKMDLNRDSFRNGGTSLQFYTNSHSLVIYDKVQDLQKPIKRSMDKDYNYLQPSLFGVLARKEILRIEVRLAKQVKLNAVLKSLGFKVSPCFREVFKKTLCQSILLKYWNDLIASENLFLFDVENDLKKTLNSIFRDDGNIAPKNALYLVGLKVLAKEGIRDLRAIIEQYATPRTWYRISKDLDLLERVSPKTYHGWVGWIGESLQKFEPFQLSPKGISNVKNSKVLYQ